MISRSSPAWSSITLHLLFMTFLALQRSAQSNLTLPAVFSDNMVIQQGRNVSVWGWSNRGSTVTASIGEAKASDITDPEGAWHIYLDP